jgi:hypothetical protein
MIAFISPEKSMVNKKSYDIKTISSAQIRAARALIRWTAEDLAAKSTLGVATIRRAEATDGPLQMTSANLSAVRRALEGAGIEFIDENGGGPGVRLRKPRVTEVQSD